MEVEFIEAYIRLSELEPGQVAVSKDRKSIFVCTWFFNTLKKGNEKGYFDINYPADQYTGKRDLSQPVRKLNAGDRFVITV